MREYNHIFSDLCGKKSRVFQLRHEKDGDVSDDIFCFDIETSTFFEVRPHIYLSEQEIIDMTRREDPAAWGRTAEQIMQESPAGAVTYMWQFGFNDVRYYGRDLADFVRVLDFLSDRCKCKVFVHNLSYEMQFLRGIIKFDKIFLTDSRSVLYMEYKNITFACTYKLTNLSLRQWGKNIGIAKLDTLHYNARVRTPKTILDPVEVAYGERDIEIMYHGIKQYLMDYKTVWDIPLTQTGTLRRDIKKTFAKDVKYHCAIVDMMPKTANDLFFLRKTFRGATVTANVLHVNQIAPAAGDPRRIGSYDKTSAYPFIQCTKKFPASEFTPADLNVKLYDDAGQVVLNDGLHHIFVVRFYGITSKTVIHTQPTSKRIMASNMSVDNGKLISADVYECFLTELDAKEIALFYKWTSYEIVQHKVAASDYLPKELVLLLLDYYGRKTKLKGIRGQEVNYMRGKEKMNAGYGCFATYPCKDDIVVSGHDAPEIVRKTDDEVTNMLMSKYEKKWGEIVAYSWGIYVTSWQRLLLGEMIAKMTPDDFWYSDTDCVKGYVDKYAEMFNEENCRITAEIRRVCEERDIEFDLFTPCDIKGNPHLLGLWDYEETYHEFKMLGQKRYAYRETEDAPVVMVVSGVPKVATAPASLDGFKFGLSWDIFSSGKLLVQYKDGDNLQVILNKGKPDEYEVSNPCAVTMRSMSYEMRCGREYKALLDTYLSKKDRS